MLRDTADFTCPRGLHFQCTRCALCCGDTKTRIRHVLLLKREAEQISETASKPIERFATRIEGHEPYVYEMKKTRKQGKCIFLKESICTIYPSRPLICRFYPFQLTAQNREYAFISTKECPGIGRGKRLERTYFERLLRQAHEKLTADSAEVPAPSNSVPE